MAQTGDAVAASAIRAARQESNIGFATHDVAPIARHWLPGMLVTQATLGEHTVSAATNAAMLTVMFATRDRVLYCRTPDRIQASSQLGMAAEEGCWEGSWLDADGARQGKRGVYLAQWRLQPDSARWLLNAEVFVPVSPVPSPNDAVAERAVRQARACSNAAFAVQDIDAIAEHWLPEVHVTHSNGNVIGGVAANCATLSSMFAEHGDLNFDRRTRAVLLDLDTAGGVAAELGRWLGTWTEKQPDGRVTEKSRSGSYCAQWRRQPSGIWLINAEVFILEDTDSTIQEPRL